MRPSSPCDGGYFALRIAVLFLLLLATPVAAQDDPANTNAERFQVAPTGYIQFDFRGFPGWGISTGTGRLSRDTIEIRRVRAGLEGSWRRLSFEFGVDPNDDDEGVIVQDAYGEIRFGGYRLRLGQFKLPGSREYGQSSRGTDLLERAALASSLAAHRDLGAMVTGDIRDGIDFEAGLFAGDRNGDASRADVTAAARVEWEPRDELVVAVFGSEGRVRAGADDDPERGFTARAPSGYRFFDDIYVNGRRTRFGGDVEWSPADWQFTVEALRIRDERKEQGLDFEDLPAVAAIGASLTARWRFAARRDVAMRYELLAVDDVGPETAFDSVRPRATDVRARSLHAVTFGGSWQLRPWLRLLGNAGAEWFPETTTAPDPTRSGPYWVFGSRLQLELP